MAIEIFIILTKRHLLISLLYEKSGEMDFKHSEIIDTVQENSGKNLSIQTSM